jgi:hypothetical protein
MHPRLPKRARLNENGPQRLKSFKAWTVKGEWLSFEKVNPLTVLWKTDFETRKPPRTELFHRMGEVYTVYLRVLKQPQ